MRSRLIFPVTIFLAGVGCVAAAAMTGEAEVQLFIIFPLVSGSGWLFLLGVILIVASFIVGFVLVSTVPADMPGEGANAGQMEGVPGKARGRSKYGGIVLVGPVPIVFGSDRGMTMAMLVVGIVLTAILVAFVLLKL